MYVSPEQNQISVNLLKMVRLKVYVYYIIGIYTIFGNNIQNGQ